MTNCVKNIQHSIVTLFILVELNNKQIEFTLTNSLPEKNSTQRQHGNQLAQQNVRERLTALYGNRGKLEVSEKEDMYQVSLQFPYELPNQVEAHEDFDR